MDESVVDPKQGEAKEALKSRLKPAFDRADMAE